MLFRSIPPGNYFVFDKQKGKEKLWFIWASAPVPVLEPLKQWVNPKDMGAIRDTEQAKAVALFLQKAAAPGGVTAGPASMNQMTVLKSTQDILVRRIDLEHD